LRKLQIFYYAKCNKSSLLLPIKASGQSPRWRPITITRIQSEPQDAAEEEEGEGEAAEAEEEEEEEVATQTEAAEAAE